jgi:hypothetical protein
MRTTLKLNQHFLFGALLVLGVIYALARPASALAMLLRAPLCALVAAQIVCYDALTLTPRVLTSADMHIVDLAVSPDSTRLAYRALETLRIGSIDGTSARVIDAQAGPPAVLDLSQATLVWSPTGQALAYVTSGGLRVAFFPGDGTPQYAESSLRLYSNLHFSPSGARLAAQAVDGSWNLFEVRAGQPSPLLQRTQNLTTAGDLAWLDDENVLLAPFTGGLLRLNAARLTDGAWRIPGERFARLLNVAGGQVVGLRMETADTIGQPVMITSDGRITPLGNARIDSRVEWGPGGQFMAYITSGTVIIVDPATGHENTLRIRRVSRLAWGAPPAVPAVAPGTALPPGY